MFIGVCLLIISRGLVHPELISDETIVTDDRLSIVLKPPMLLIDFKITVADIVNPKKKKVLVQILLSAFQKQNGGS